MLICYWWLWETVCDSDLVKTPIWHTFFLGGNKYNARKKLVIILLFFSVFLNLVHEIVKSGRYHIDRADSVVFTSKGCHCRLLHPIGIIRWFLSDETGCSGNLEVKSTCLLIACYFYISSSKICCFINYSIWRTFCSFLCRCYSVDKKRDQQTKLILNIFYTISMHFLM
jgi:hypothetical protein